MFGGKPREVKATTQVRITQFSIAKDDGDSTEQERDHAGPATSGLEV
jgi:hypothetical protein